MKLDPRIKRQIENTHNLTIPHPTDTAFAPFMEALFKSQPEVAKQLEQAIILESLGDPKSLLEHKALVAERLNRLKHTLFFRFDDIQSRWFPSRTKIILLSITPIVFFMAAMYAPKLLPDFGAVAQNPAVQAVGHQLGFGSLYEVDLGRAPQDIPIQGANPTSSKREAITRDEVPEAAPAPIQNRVEETPLPPPLQSVTKYQRETNPSPKVFSRERTVSARDPLPPQTENARLSVFQRERSVEGLSIISNQQTLPTLSIMTRETSMEVLSQDGGEGGVNPSFNQDPFDVTDSLKVSDSFDASENPISEPSFSEPSLTPGLRLSATLEVGIISIHQQKVPVIAKAEDDSLWQGEASLSNQRFVIEFHSVVIHGKSQPVRAYAVASDGFVGLPVVWRETTPTLAGDLLRGSLRGISNYVEDLSQQTTITQDELGKTITQNLAPLEMQLLGSLSEMFQPSTQEALVRIAELPQGTPFTLLLF